MGNKVKRPKLFAEPNKLNKRRANANFTQVAKHNVFFGSQTSFLKGARPRCYSHERNALSKKPSLQLPFLREKRDSMSFLAPKPPHSYRQGSAKIAIAKLAIEKTAPPPPIF